MNETIRQAIIDGSPGITIAVKASDLKNIVCAIVRAEKAAMRAEVEAENEKAMLTRKEAMAILGISEATLLRWKNDKYLVPVKVGRKVLYKRSDIDKLLTRRSA